VVVLPALLLEVSQAQAAGFAIREQSGSGLGNAFAGGPTGIDDPSFIYSNPASMGFLSGHQATTYGSFIIPSTKFKEDSSSTVLGTPITTNSLFEGNDDIGRNAFVPGAAGMISVTDDIRVGFSFNVPFGLLTDNSGGWVGRYHAEKSQLKTINLNPAVAYRINNRISIGAGFNAMYADAELSNAVDFGTIGTAAIAGNPLIAPLFPTAPAPSAQDGRAKLTGDDWGFGGNAGIMFQATDNLRLGLAYRSHVSLEIDGETDFDLDSAGVGATLNALTGAFADSDMTADIELPETVTFGANFDLNDEFSFMGQVEWTNWSRFDELRIEFDNAAQADSVTEEDWDDSWFFAVGGTYRPARVEGLTLRLGFAYDQTPVPNGTRTPRIPDEDRYWLAGGVGYAPLPWLSVDLSYTHIFVPDADIDLDATDEGNTFRGNLSGKYEADIDIVALQGTVRF
jgi:long-chain fatty acid transport protein